MRLIAPLPDPFLLPDGGRVSNRDDWRAHRPKLLDLLLNTQYGTVPPPPDVLDFVIGQTHDTNQGHRRRTDCLTMTPHQDRPGTRIDLQVTVTFPLDEVVVRRKERLSSFGQNGLPAILCVGGKTHNAFLNSGYVVVNYPNDMLEPMETGKPMLGPAREAYRKLFRDQHSWGSIAVWAWGAVCVLDYVVRVSEVDRHQVSITGHSRNGKTALLAGALDERFAVVNPAGSGCAGAGSYLALGEDCEDLAALTSRDRWWAWTHPEFEKWAGREADLPFDQHFLMAAIAPRPLLRTEGTDDTWANPEGTSATYLATQPVYDLLGVPERNTIAYRDGGHDHTEEDAQALVDLCDETFFGVPRSRDFGKTLPPSEAGSLFTWSTP
ncbi:TPA: hypothetical protein DCE37_21665 [Candidatus Latescibacteria bacterium]|nr:hypothetical protein [Candidatus Latescibacterota bacterium]